MPSGTQPNASPAPIATGKGEEAPPPSKPGNPTNPPGNDGDNTGIDVNFN
jgi:hypothetical protein